MTKYLGIYFDNNLKWNRYTEHANFKLNRGIGVLQKTRKFVQDKTLRNIFNAFLKLYLEYDTLVWSRASKKTFFKQKYDIVKPFNKYLQSFTKYLRLTLVFM